MCVYIHEVCVSVNVLVCVRDVCLCERERGG